MQQNVNLQKFFKLFHEKDIIFQLVSTGGTQKQDNPQLRLNDLSELNQFVEKLEARADQGYKVYFITNPGGTKNDDIFGVNAQFIDIDFHEFEDATQKEQKKNETVKMLKELKLKPTAIVMTPNGVHAYWHLKEEESKRHKVLERFIDTQKMMAEYFGSCTGVTNRLGQAMRVPSPKFGGKIVEINPDQLYTQEEIRSSFYAETEKPKARNQQNTGQIEQVNNKIKIYNISDFFEVAKQQDIRKYLKTNVLLNKSFNCFYHHDNNPSAVISKKNGRYQYFCNSSNCRAYNGRSGLTIIDLLQLDGMTKWQDIISQITNTFNIELVSTKWMEGQKNKYIANLTFLKDELEEMKSTDILTRYGIIILEKLLNIGLTKITPELHDENGEAVFFTSNRYLSREKNKPIEKVNAYLNLFCMLGLLNKVDPPKNHKVTQESLKRARENNRRVINFYSVPNYYEIKNQIENRAFDLRKQGFSINTVSQVYVKNYDEELAKKVYHSNENISEFGIKVREKILEKAESQIYHYGYTHDKLLAGLKVSGRRIKKERLKQEFKKVIPILIDKGYILKPANNKLKSKFNIKSKGYPKILLKPEDHEL
ncbi:hypothetical protein [Natranaerobius thermophilus]|uniref:hypothetical protein n=1 Tax=Natranaerobius thermophilus TaxID=375929 RepID=UPI002F41AA2F